MFDQGLKLGEHHFHSQVDDDTKSAEMKPLQGACGVFRYLGVF